MKFNPLPRLLEESYKTVELEPSFCWGDSEKNDTSVVKVRNILQKQIGVLRQTLTE
jgi:hypothetical protein